MTRHLRQRILAALAFLALCMLLPVPAAHAITIDISSLTLPLSPGGPYSLARDKTVGTVLATADATISATGVSGSCLATAFFLSSSPASGNTFTTGVSGLGVNLYYYNGATRTQIAPGVQSSLPVVLTGPGLVTTIEAQLVVTGAVSSGTLSSLPSLNLTFTAVGLGCGVLSLSNQTVNVTATNGTVTAVTCTVSNSAITVNLPTVSTTTLNGAGRTAGTTGFDIPLSCGGTGANVYVTLTDATNTANTTSLLTLKPASTAGNVKLQILKSDGTAVSYGPDSAAAGNTNQWLVGGSDTVTNIPLKVQYYATGVASAGSVQAAATFTMSYQ